MCNSYTVNEVSCSTQGLVYVYFRDALEKKDYAQLADLMKQNFSTRRYGRNMCQQVAQ